MTIAENVKRIKDEIGPEVTLVAATKTNDAARIQEAILAGVPVCGENRVQEMLEKIQLNAYSGSSLHFIGHLQKNKVKNVVGAVELIHGVDSVSLLQEINRVSELKGLVQDVLLEVNIANEPSKSGFEPSEIIPSLEAVSGLKNVRIRGLMAIPPICSKPVENRPYFEQMKQLFVDISYKKYDNNSMDFLSMGMSGDYLEAVSCGSNMVRIGTGIFGPRK